jgi:hypothetical protein
MFKKLNCGVLNKSIEEFIGTYNIDTDPAHQRPQIPDLKKRKGILKAISNGIDTGEIKLNQFSSEPEYEVIDGSNRLRSIKQYYNNEFPIYGRTFKQLSSDEKRGFLDYPLRFIVYDNLTPAEKAEQFLSTNESTQVVFPEKMNSYGVIPIANLIRETVRDIPSVDDSFIHGLFDCHFTNKNNISYRYLDFTNDRLTMDDMVSRITYLNHMNNGLVPHGDDLIERMYQDHAKFSDTDIKSLQKKNKAVLDFLQKCATQRRQEFNKGLQKWEFVCLYRLYFHLTKMLDEKGEKLKITDYKEFYLAFRDAYNKFMSKTASRTEEISLGLNKNGQEKKDTVNALFLASLKNHDANTPGSMQGCTQTIVWLLEEFQVEDFIEGLDNRRAFSYEEISNQWQLQGRKCAITGEDLLREDTAGAHIIPHSLGGKTCAKTNLWATSKYHNTKMHTQNAIEYKADYLKSLEETV